MINYRFFLNSPSNGKFVRMLRPYDSSAILLFFLRYYVQVQVDHTTFSAISSRQALGFPTRTRQNYKLLIKGRCKNKLRGYPFSEWVWLCACAHTIFGCIFVQTFELTNFKVWTVLSTDDILILVYKCPLSYLVQ